MNIKYRPEIDGLRAIAVSAVILYHAQIILSEEQFFSGGFIGVDIFFVISGYLITSIILKELITTKKFSFSYFYERRIRRILPALLFVILASLPFAWLYLLPNSFIDFSKSIIHSLFFTSNFYFPISGQAYGAESALLKPFLHIWSLSVEEQYYIIFPAFFLISYRYFKKYFELILLFTFITSLAVAEYGSRNYPGFNFYLIFSRIWELMAGSIIAYYEIVLGHRGKNRILNLFLPSVGFFLIGFSIFFFNDEMRHPSLFTLFPIIGVCLIIWFSNQNEIFTKLLSNRYIVGVGLISYSLYLWHYPIFAFDRITEFSQDNIMKKIFVATIVFFLSIFSYYLIERPARNKRNKFRYIFLLIISIFIMLITFSSSVILKKDFKSRLPEILTKNLVNPEILLKNSNGSNCYNNVELCKFNTSSKRKIFLIGDSHMASIMNDLKIQTTKKDYQFITSVKSLCVYFPGFNLVDIKTKRINKKCNDTYFKNLEKILINQKNSIIIFGGRFPLYLEEKLFDNKEGGLESGEWKYEFISNNRYDYTNIQSSFKSSLLKLSQKNKIFIIYPIPEVGVNPNKKIFLQWTKKGIKESKNFNLNPIDTSYKVYKDRSKSSFELLDSIQNKNIYRVYPHKLFCNTQKKDRCLTHDKKNVFYYDDDHLSEFGIKMLNKHLMKLINRINF